MAWRLAHSLELLRSEVNERWPHRSKISDGTLGDARHQATKSDHNPNAAGVVRAFDCTANVGDRNPANVDGEWLFQHVISLGKNGHPALGNHGYVIFNHRSAYATNGWKVVAYHGVSAHTEHVHISVGRTAAQYDSLVSWQIAAPLDPAPAPKPQPPKPKPVEEDMARIVKVKESGSLWVMDGVSRRTVTTKDAGLLAIAGLAQLDKGGVPFVLPRSAVELVPENK